MLADKENTVGETVNIGSSREISIGELVKLITEIIGVNIDIESDDIRKRPTNSEVERLLCDNTKIKNLTGFEPQISLREGLTRTINWLEQTENLKKYKVDIYNV